MTTISILTNPLANSSSSSFSESPQIISNPSNPSPDQPQAPASQPDETQSVTEVIIEALRSKDRLFVLKLGEQMEALINERKLVVLFPVSHLFHVVSAIGHRSPLFISLTSFHVVHHLAYADLVHPERG